MRSWQVNAIAEHEIPAASLSRLAAEGLPASLSAGTSSSWESGNHTRRKP